MMNHTPDIRDVFICYTSKDREQYVTPFIQELSKSGISYWVDIGEIGWGDIIFKKINEGLEISRYVVVFLSQHFMGRNWPEAELASALSLENAKGETVVLPIIIGDQKAILERYPLLRGKSYTRWDRGLSSITGELKQRIRSAAVTTTRTAQNRSLPHIKAFHAQDTQDLPKEHLYPSKDILREFASYGGMLNALNDPREQSDLALFLLDSFSKILIGMYHLLSEEQSRKIRISHTLLDYLNDLSSRRKDENT